MSYNLEEALVRCEAILKGHFELASGKHSSIYFQLARLLSYPEEANSAGNAIAELFRSENVESVIGPAIGGIVLSFVVAQALNLPSYFAEHRGKNFILRRGFKFHKGERVLVVEDVLTTGGSAMDVVELVKKNDAVPVGIGALVNRGNFHSDQIVSHALFEITAPMYEPGRCPLCLDKKPLEKPGSSPRKKK